MSLWFVTHFHTNTHVDTEISFSFFVIFMRCYSTGDDACLQKTAPFITFNRVIITFLTVFFFKPSNHFHTIKYLGHRSKFNGNFSSLLPLFKGLQPLTDQTTFPKTFVFLVRRRIKIIINNFFSYTLS